MNVFTLKVHLNGNTACPLWEYADACDSSILSSVGDISITMVDPEQGSQDCLFWTTETHGKKYDS